MVLEYSVTNQKIIHSFAVGIFWLSNVLKIYYFYVVTANDKGGGGGGGGGGFFVWGGGGGGGLRVVHLC